MSRIDKINQLVKKEVSYIIQREFSDPRMQFVTVTGVSVTKDLRFARVRYSVLGDEKKMQDVQNILDHASGYIRKLVGKSMKTRYTPEFQFIFDKNIEYGIHIDQKLKEVMSETPEENAGGEDPGEMKEKSNES